MKYGDLIIYEAGKSNGLPGKTLRRPPCHRTDTHKYRCPKILVDTGSSADILFKSTLERMGIDQSEITKKKIPLVGFLGEATMTLGFINLAVKAVRITKVIEFLVIDRAVSYNAIVGTPWLNSMRAIPSTFHLCVKFPTPRGIKTIWEIRKYRRSASPQN
ncbi:hypothetical protein N665_0013s0004 [Sinapis alba]|nr:hypothetical protein N665_0013s0004 [Sinapis alba]